MQECFASYDWPGNVRELENVSERLVLIAKEDMITLENMPEDLRVAICRPATLPQREVPHKAFGFGSILRDQKEEIEKQVIVRVLGECGGNVTRAAAQLGLSRKGLQMKMIRHRLRK